MENESILQLIPLREVSRITGLSKSALWRRINSGDFPHPVKLGTVSRWERGEVLAFVRARIAERESKQHQPQPIAA